MSDKVNKPFYKKTWFIVLVVIVVLGVVGGAMGGNDDKPKKVDSTTQTENKTDNKEEEKEESNGPQIFNIVDVIEADDYKITVNGVRSATVDSTGYYKPKDGYEFFLVNITLENISDEDKTVSSIMMFKVVDQNGVSYDMTIFPDAQGSLDGTVAPTRKMTGEYCVEVPQGTTGLELEFEDIFSKQVIVKLN